MKARPIIFSAPMVRALLDRSKTQTRRVVKLPLKCKAHGASINSIQHGDEREILQYCPYGQPGDLLWVRETWGLFNDWGFCDTSLVGVQEEPGGWTLTYRSDHLDSVNGDGPHRPVWRSPIHMPRWASRLTLLLTDVRIERVQEISTDDTSAEGVPLRHDLDHPRVAFRELWDSLNAKRGYSWADNPWVWALTFRVIQTNVNGVMADPDRYIQEVA